MPAFHSPLRYPGGKASLSKFLSEVISINGLKDATYAEPYAGGAGAALTLLFEERVSRVMLNDADPCIFAFWHAVLTNASELVRRIKDTPVTIEEWHRQREIYRAQQKYSRIKVAFATFFLNRCNRSGIIVNGGPIGGLEQSGKWKLDARYNKTELIRRIEKINLYTDRIEIHSLDAIDFLRYLVKKNGVLGKLLIYLDPPYYVQGHKLYLNYYLPADHQQLADYLRATKRELFWLLTYDNVPEIETLYRDYRPKPFMLAYSAHDRRMGSELLIHGRTLQVLGSSLQSVSP